MIPAFKRSVRATPTPPKSLYGQLFRSVLWPAWETGLRRRPTLDRLAALEASQWRSQDELREEQERALMRLLNHAYAHVPLYRERFERAGLTPSHVRSLDDLMKLPVLTHDDVRGDRRLRQSRVAPRPTIWKSTSGTTGEPLVLGYEPSSEYWRQAIKWRGYSWAGYEPGDRVLHLWGVPPTGKESWKARAKIALDRSLKRERYVPCAVLGERELHDVVRLIAREGPHVLVCYTQAGAALARFVNRNGLRDWDDIAVICGAERLYPHDRTELEKAFGRGIFESYGCREVMLLASECDAHDGLHVSMENLVVEIVVTEPDGTARRARAGELGEVVVTDLHNLSMPFIRYANGDLATAGSGAPCRCGRGLERIASVEGRTSDTLRDATGALVNGVVFGHMFVELESVVRKFQLVQHPDLTVTLRVAAEHPLAATTIARLRASCERFLRGVDVTVDVVDDVRASAMGKRRLVVAETSRADDAHEPRAAASAPQF
jgi:phenylacetate-CoA ligase